MFYTIYVTTNTENGKKYIGKHATNNLNDDYLGSGIVLNKAIKKYGKEKFIKEILFVFNTEDEMNQKEKELVTSDIVLSEDYYNIALGGIGGAIVLKQDHPLYEVVCRKISEAQCKRSADMSRITAENHKLKRVGMYGKKQSEHQRETVRKLMKDKPKSAETISKQKESLSKTFSDPNYIHPNKGKAKIRLTCPHCAKEVGGVTNYNRYHGDKCKLKTNK